MFATLNRSAHRSTATHFHGQAASPRQPGFTLASSILYPGMDPGKWSGENGGHVIEAGGGTHSACPSAHSGDNKARLCVFYSFQYLSDPEGSLGHKVS